MVVGRRDFLLGKFMTELKRVYDISVQSIEKPGDELTFLKRLYTLQADGRLTVQTREKHISQLCGLLGMNPGCQNKKTPAHADIDKGDNTAVYRTCVGILMYLANDVPHAQHVIRHLATYSSKPTEKSLLVLRHLVAYLASHKDVCVSLKWEGQTSGIFRLPQCGPH